MNTASTTVGELIVAFLEHCGVTTAFGVISIHNMPILDACGRRGKIRFVSSRGEAGAVNMADGYARAVVGLGVAVTSTGTGAGNAAGALIEAQTASTPLLHLTGQIESAYLDSNSGYIHEARDQLGMLKAVSKAAFRVRSAQTALATVRAAVRLALTPPCGPVSVEIPIDIQQATVSWPTDLRPALIPQVHLDEQAVERLAARLTACKRPMLWLGGGARHAGSAVARLADLGLGIVTSTQGRGVMREDDPRTLAAFNMQPPVEAFYQSCDAMLVVGSRLRGNETLKYTLKLPRPLWQIDIDLQAENRSYAVDDFICSDSALALGALADHLSGRIAVDPQFQDDLAAAAAAARQLVRDSLGPYDLFVAALQQALGEAFIWVRDITLSNSIWGNRLLAVFESRAGIHAVGGGIGQGLPMAIGAALARSSVKTLALVGDGGLQLCLSELATAVQERVHLVLIVMNDGGYGVIKNIQDAHYGGRHYYVDVHNARLRRPGCCSRHALSVSKVYG